MSHTHPAKRSCQKLYTKRSLKLVEHTGSSRSDSRMFCLILSLPPSCQGANKYSGPQPPLDYTHQMRQPPSQIKRPLPQTTSFQVPKYLLPFFLLQRHMPRDQRDLRNHCWFQGETYMSRHKTTLSTSNIQHRSTFCARKGSDKTGIILRPVIASISAAGPTGFKRI